MNAPSSRGYPLGALFVLVTAAATIIAGLAPVVRSFRTDDVESMTILLAVAAGFAGGGLLGMILGLYQFRWVVGASIGLISGTCVGIVAGLLVLAPPRLLPQVAIAFVVGSGLMIGVALVTRRVRE
jgi:hypothetical protein